jgi:hypothetical protein
MAKVAEYFVSCKSDPNAKLQFWDPACSLIYSRCQHCGASTGYDQEPYDEHYTLYEIAVSKERGMSYEDCFNKAEQQISADRSKYAVTKFSPKLDLERRRLQSK